MRPKGYSDLNILWAIRDLPSDLISWNERSVLWFLLSIIGNNESCIRTINQLSDKCGLSRSSLIRHLNSLVKSKFIQIYRPRNQGRGQANEYFLNYETILSAIKLSTKGIKLTPFVEESMSNRHPLNEESMSNLKNKGVRLKPHRYIKKDIKEKERESFASLPPDFVPDQKTKDEIKSLCFKKGEADEIGQAFMEYFLDSGEARKNWQFEARKWFRRERKMIDERPTKNKKSQAHPVSQPIRETRVAEEWKTGDPQTAKDYLSKIMGRLNGKGAHDNDTGNGKIN